MSNPSNLYAEKIYSEHPTVLWSLDDTADYISLISEEDRQMYIDWNVSNGTAYQAIFGMNDSKSLISVPIKGTATSMLWGAVPTGATNTVECISPELINFSNLEQSLGTFCVGAYFYAKTAFLTSIEIGYEYTDTTTALVVQHLESFDVNVSGTWSFISQTFQIPAENTTARIVIKANMSSGGADPSDYSVFINGISFGQWSEEFNTQSVGVNSQAFPATIDLDTDCTVIPAYAYGISSDTGYYLVKDNLLLAKNTGVPLVFGASNITKLIPNTDSNPSLIVPGKGFLNELGRYKDYTVEFWARINSDTSTPKRIFGPIASQDGLYVESGFLTLVIGDTFKSHFVGEWFRPMLIHIRIIKNSASLILNGEEVISFPIDTARIDLPLPDTTKDWLGFYAYEDVTPVEIDCVAIYSYQVPVTLAKRRWVYGQGVISPEGINSAYGGVSAFIDYPFAKYTSNYSYPNLAKWEQGTFDNLSTTSIGLTTPTYSLPEIFLDTKTIAELYADCKTIQSGNNKFITFRPNGTWENINAYINFTNFRVLNDQIHSVYGVFQVNDDDLTNQVLFKIYNSITGNFFSIIKNGPNINYSLTYNGAEQEFYTIENFAVEEPIAVGVQIQTLIDVFGGNIAAFFGNQNGLKFYVGGDESGDLTFTGNIYSVGLSTSLNATSISNHFNETGIAIIEDAQDLINHTASYTLLPTEGYGKFYLDIGVSGYWEDYMPLSYFAKYVKNDVGNEYYDLDFLQFNISYPSPSSLFEDEIIESWTYQELVDEFHNPIQKTYEQFDNSLYTGWANYEDANQRSNKYYEYDTSKSLVRSYLTFQYIKNGANYAQENFTTTILPRNNSVIDLDEHPNWSTTKFEVVNNTIIYPTQSVDFNSLAIVYHLDFNVRGILTKPISVKKLEIASQAFDHNTFSSVGTRFGVDLFPYTKTGFYYDYKAKNPFTIYKESTPYLYLNKDSGIQLRGDFDSFSNRGISMSINENVSDNYRVSALQMWLRYEKDLFPVNPVELFEVNYSGDTIKFYIVSDNEIGNRARIYATNQSDGSDFEGIAYYINGSLVRDPRITLKDWSVLGVGFASPLNFDEMLGSINLTGPMIFNNIAYYQANNLQQLQSNITRPWIKVKSSGLVDYLWEYWFPAFNWSKVLIIGTSSLYGVNPSDVYKTYLGTNKTIIDDGEGMTFDADKIKVYSDTTWSSSFATPV
jgi:hypothetical protein